jgi:hypothetical protein
MKDEWSTSGSAHISDCARLLAASIHVNPTCIAPL